MLRHYDDGPLDLGTFLPESANCTQRDFVCGSDYNNLLIRNSAGVANSLSRWLEQRTMRKSKV
jgi:hypothetical protein